MRAARLFAGAVLLCAAFALHAAGNPPPAAGFAATFVQTRTLPGFDSPLVSHGTIRVDPAQGFRWEITAPYHYVFAMENGHVRETLPDGTVRNFDADREPWLAAVEHIFVSALSGNRSELQRFFDVSVEPLPGGKGRHVALTPRPGALAKVIVRIDVTEAAPGRPKRLQIRETSGGRMDIRFTPVTGKP